MLQMNPASEIRLQRDLFRFGVVEHSRESELIHQEKSREDCEVVDFVFADLGCFMTSFVSQGTYTVREVFHGDGDAAVRRQLLDSCKECAFKFLIHVLQARLESAPICISGWTSKARNLQSFCLCKCFPNRLRQMIGYVGCWWLREPTSDFNFANGIDGKISLFQLGVDGWVVDQHCPTHAFLACVATSKCLNFVPAIYTSFVQLRGNDCKRSVITQAVRAFKREGCHEY